MSSQCKCCSTGFKFIRNRRSLNLCYRLKFFLLLKNLGDDGTSNLSSIEVLNISSLEQQPWTHLSVSINQPRSYAGVALLPKVA
ncbi:unnamed protein product [Brugia timori]|uniref:Ovule protein n=1 Tax=Brugia timori TaxID=42155 RepID=A0A0R3QB57_9BILA|nr:unnamed protein product [Brugia timori]